MTAPIITVAVPVYNGEAFIGECLSALEAQTFQAMTVLIYDNASTDRTGEIAREFCARDPRFKYHCNAENIGSGRNFIDALNAAETPFFLWRADDDLCSPNYLEQLHTALEAAPDAVLAAPCVEAREPAKARVIAYPFVEAKPGPRIATILRQMFKSHPSWLYGVWRTDALRRHYLTTWEKYPTGVSNDHLVLLGVILDQTVVGSNEVRFIQRIGVRASGPAPKRSAADQLSEREERMRTFGALCREAVEARDWSVIERAILRVAIRRYAAKRAMAPWGKMMRLRLRRALQGASQ